MQKNISRLILLRKKEKLKNKTVFVDKIFVTFFTQKYYLATFISCVKLVLHTLNWDTCDLWEWESTVSQVSGMCRQCRVYIYMYLPIITATIFIARKYPATHFSEGKNLSKKMKNKNIFLWKKYIWCFFLKNNVSSTFITRLKLALHILTWDTCDLWEWESTVSQVSGMCRQCGVYFYMYLPILLLLQLFIEKYLATFFIWGKKDKI